MKKLTTTCLTLLFILPILFGPSLATAGDPISPERCGIVNGVCEDPCTNERTPSSPCIGGGICCIVEGGGGGPGTPNPPTGFVPCDGTDCSACHLAVMANTIIKWLIGILFLIFAVLMFIAGFGLVTSAGNVSAKEAAKGKFSNAIIGIIIVFAAWLIVDTIIRGLVVGDGDDGKSSGEIKGYGPWSEIECYEQAEPFTPEGLFDPLVIKPYDVNDWKRPDGSNPIADIGTGNLAIVKFAEAMRAQGCKYDQKERNACRGNPGYTDCSDLVHTAYTAAGCPSPGYTTAMMHPKAGTGWTKDTLKAGDAIVYRYPSSRCDGGVCGHVVICREDGCNTVIHAKGKDYGIVVDNSASYLSREGARVIKACAGTP